MSRALIVLGFKKDRDRAKTWIDKAPVNTRLEFKAPRRTLPQNDRMHAMLTDIARQMPEWGGIKVSKDDWKFIFLDALKRELRLVPNLDGTGLVNLSGRSSSDLSVEEMTGLIDLMFKFGAERGIEWTEPDRTAEDRGARGNTAPRRERAA